MLKASLLLAASLLKGGLERPAPKPGVTVILRAEPATQARVESALQEADLPVTLAFAPLPNAPAPSSETRRPAQAVATARQSYVDANLRECVAAVSTDALWIEALAAGARAEAARVLFWRVACQVGLGAAAPAREEARRMAVLRLPAPEDMGRTTPEVERLLAGELKRAEGARARNLRVTTAAPRAQVWVDGQPVGVAPCSANVPEGTHVVHVESDGFVPETRTVRVEAEATTLDVPLTAAAPELAARQWTARYAASGAIDSVDSVRLLAKATRAPRLVVLTTDVTAVDARSRGVFASEGEPQAYAERYGSARALPDDARGLLRDLLVKGTVLEPPPSLVKRPAFWLAVGAAVAAATAATYFIVSPPPIQTQVHF